MEIIIKPVLTEKMTALTDKQRKVAFIVAKEANKIEIKKAVEAMYGVNVLAVNTQRCTKEMLNLVTRKQVLFPEEPLPSRKQL